MSTFDPYNLNQARVTAGAVRERDQGLPWCCDCDTDEYLIYEDFVPARIPAGTDEHIAASVNYSCSVCGRFNGHEVPSSRSPPNWFWYT